jgi:hydroxyacylglutathione hydrolase
MKILSLLLPGMAVNCYIPYCEETLECAVIDPGSNSERIEKLINKHNLKVRYILLTHGHFDHIGGVQYIKELTGSAVAIHKDDADMLTDPIKNLSSYMGKEVVQIPADILLEDGMVLSIGREKLKALHTPGHSRGSMSFLGDGVIFTGDLLFKSSVGRTDFPDSNYMVLMNSIRKKLMVLSDDLVVYPGHGRLTTIGEERTANPFLYDMEDF